MPQTLEYGQEDIEFANLVPRLNELGQAGWWLAEASYWSANLSVRCVYQRDTLHPADKFEHLAEPTAVSNLAPFLNARGALGWNLCATFQFVDAELSALCVFRREL